MTEEEARRIKEISDEEIAAVNRYVGFDHAGINILANLNVDSYESIRKHWLFPENENELKKYIKDFVNIYSVMCKTSKGKSLIGELIRSVQNQFLPKSGEEMTRFLSCATEEEKSVNSGNFWGTTVLHINAPQNVPFLDVEEFKRYTGNDSKDESEIILPPFCKVANIQHMYGGKSTSNNCYSHYRMRITPPQMNERGDETTEELMEKVISGFAQNMQNIKEALSERDMPEIWQQRCKNITDTSDKAFCSEQYTASIERYTQLSKQIEQYRDKLQILLKRLCRERERQIAEADNVIANAEKQRAESERKKLEQQRIEEEKRVQEQTRISHISSMRMKILESPEKENQLYKLVSSNYEELKREEDTYSNVARKLGIQFSLRVAQTNIGRYVTQIEQNLIEVRSFLSDVSVSDNNSIDDIYNIKGKYESVLDGIVYGNLLAANLPGIVTQYKSQLDLNVKKALFFKVQDTMKKARLQKYRDMKSEIETEKNPVSTMFGRIFWRISRVIEKITGKNDLQEERMKNIDLRTQLEKSLEVEEPEQLSVRQMLIDMHVCAQMEFGGTFTPEMQSLYNSIMTEYGSKKQDGVQAFSEEYFRREASKKIAQMNCGNNLPTTQNGKKGRIKDEIHYYRQENLMLEQKIAQKGKKLKPTVSQYNQNEDALNLFEHQLKGIVASTTRDSNLLSKEIDLGKTVDIWE